MKLRYLTFRVRCRATGDVGDIRLVIDRSAPAPYPWEPGLLQAWLWQHPDYEDPAMNDKRKRMPTAPQLADMPDVSR